MPANDNEIKPREYYIVCNCGSKQVHAIMKREPNDDCSIILECCNCKNRTELPLERDKDNEPN